MLPRVVSLTTSTIDLVQDTQDRFYVCEFGAAHLSAHDTYTRLYGKNIFDDKIMPYYQQLFPHSDIRINYRGGTSRWSPASADGHVVAAPFIRPASWIPDMWQAMLPGTFMAGLPHQVAMTYFSKTYAQALVEPGLFPKSEILYPGDPNPARLAQSFGDVRVMVKAGMSWDGHGMRVMHAEELPDFARTLWRSNYVAQELVDTKPREFPGVPGSFNTSLRAWVSFVGFEDGSFAHVLHGHVREIASLPKSANDLLAFAANKVSATAQHPLAEKLDPETAAALEKFIKDQAAPAFRALMQPCYEGILEKRKQVTEHNDTGRRQMLAELSWRRAVPVFTGIRRRRDRSPDYVPNTHVGLSFG